jgi:hypothetical protein
MNKLLPLLAALGVAVAACESKAPAVAAAGHKWVTVEIKNGVIVPDSDPIIISGGGHVIHWVIVTDGYTFPDEGIALKDGPNSEIDNAHPANQGKVYQVNDKNSRAADIRYSIKVNGSPPVPTLDPTIRNQG